MPKPTENQAKQTVSSVFDTVFKHYSTELLNTFPRADGEKFLLALLKVARPYDGSGCVNPQLPLGEYRKFARKIDTACDMVMEKLGATEDNIIIKEYTSGKFGYVVFKLEITIE